MGSRRRSRLGQDGPTTQTPTVCAAVKDVDSVDTIHGCVSNKSTIACIRYPYRWISLIELENGILDRNSAYTDYAMGLDENAVPDRLHVVGLRAPSVSTGRFGGRGRGAVKLLRCVTAGGWKDEPRGRNGAARFGGRKGRRREGLLFRSDREDGARDEVPPG